MDNKCENNSIFSEEEILSEAKRNNKTGKRKEIEENTGKFKKRMNADPRTSWYMEKPHVSLFSGKIDVLNLMNKSGKQNQINDGNADPHFTVLSDVGKFFTVFKHIEDLIQRTHVILTCLKKYLDLLICKVSVLFCFIFSDDGSEGFLFFKLIFEKIWNIFSFLTTTRIRVSLKS